MQIVQAVRCPNCGSIAKRLHFANAKVVNADCPEERVTRTECSTCDYLMVTCSIDGRVLEAYAPGISTSSCHVLSNNLYDKPHLWKVS